MPQRNKQFNLIDAANVKAGTLVENWVKSKDDFLNFPINTKGLPVLIHADSDVFEFSDSDVFSLENTDICKKIYQHSNLNYVGFRHAFQSNQFLSSFKVRPLYHARYKSIIDENLACVNAVRNLKADNKRIGAFQTRNIPHSGHEAIITELLNHCDHVIINPVVGPKKTGDVKLKALKTAFTYLANTKYEHVISFMPVYANMYYAGPGEAIHHAFMRERIGFDWFTVGRDHAGAEGVYGSSAAVEAIENMKSNLNIQVLLHNGAGYCSVCQKVMVSGKCSCDSVNFYDVAGTAFRQCIKNQELFEFADIDMQNFLHSKHIEIFEK